MVHDIEYVIIHSAGLHELLISGCACIFPQIRGKS